MEKVDNIIIGAGPAGCTAAIYMTRAGFKPLIFGGATPGGQLLYTHEIENFPSLQEPISGPELMQKMHSQCKRLGAEILTEEVTKADLSKKPFKITASNKKQYLAKSIIIATGAKARWLDIEGEDKFRGQGVSTCATCDGFFYRNKQVCIVGGGDTAIGDAIFLTKFVNKVTVIHRRDKLRAAQILAEKAQKNPKIHFEYDNVVTKIIGDQTISAVEIKNVKNGKTKQVPVSGVFVAIGHDPNTAIFNGALKLDEYGYIMANNTRTSIEGIFVAGDVMDINYKQAIIACGRGCIAALEAEKYLNTLCAD
jgi:thioredoxin reductase (NADPH)